MLLCNSSEAMQLPRWTWCHRCVGGQQRLGRRVGCPDGRCVDRASMQPLVPDLVCNADSEGILVTFTQHLCACFMISANATQLADEVDDTVCEMCSTDEFTDQLLLCDLCSHGYHTFCLTPPLTAVPDGHWICPECVQVGRHWRMQHGQSSSVADSSSPNIFPDAGMRRREAAAEQLHGRLVGRGPEPTDPSVLALRQGLLQMQGVVASVLSGGV
eukprot:GHUV01053880.1.p1 GENE.GHUV01053880.1~~GHUV01053880.1.p1  ORF type:complete len:215 (+),score=40.33 GHUV01053880.1:152-796(+)